MQVTARDALAMRVARPDRTRRRLTDDRHDWHMITFRIIQAVEQMNGARPGGGHADADLTGKFGVRGRHERGLFLVTNLNEFEPAMRSIERTHQTVDSVARITEDAFDAPRAQALKKKITNCPRHAASPCSRFRTLIRARERCTSYRPRRMPKRARPVAAARTCRQTSLTTARSGVRFDAQSWPKRWRRHASCIRCAVKPRRVTRYDKIGSKTGICSP